MGWVAYEPTMLRFASDLSQLASRKAPPTLTLHADAPRTGLADVDAIVDAVLSGDAEELASRLALQQRACTWSRGSSGDPPQCPEGSVEGTAVTVFPVASGEFGWSPEPRASLVSNWLLGDGPLQLYAAATAEGTSRFEGEYILFFSTNDGDGEA